jgi:hypothetical protein
MSSRSISASVNEAMATKLRFLAAREDRTVSSLISNAISLYTELPPELRKAWKQMQSIDERGFQAFLREVTALHSAIAGTRRDAGGGSGRCRRRHTNETVEDADMC